MALVWTEEKIIAAIRRWAKEHDGEPPYFNEWIKIASRGYPNSVTVHTRFGSWNEGIRRAGFEPRGNSSRKPPPPAPLRGRTAAERREERIAALRKALAKEENLAD